MDMNGFVDDALMNTVPKCQCFTSSLSCFSFYRASAHWRAIL